MWKKFFIILFVFFLFFIFFLSDVFLDNKKIVILCAGDSITADSYPARLDNLIKKNNFKNVQVINLGKRGHTSGEYLKFLKSNKKWLNPFPDWVLLQLGTNDVRIDGDHTKTENFVKNIEDIIKLFREQAEKRNRKVNIAVATILPVIPSKNFDESSQIRVEKEINPQISRIAKKYNLPLLDNYSLFLKNPKELPGIHPTQKGYELIAQNWFELLLKEKFYEKK